MDKETFATRSENLGRRMAKVPELYGGLKAATDPVERRKALADAYQQLVPDESRTSLSLSLGVQAKKPQESGFSAIAPGSSLPTEARVAFSLQVSRPAHVYLFQKSPDGKLAVLFPDSRIAALILFPPAPTRAAFGQPEWRASALVPLGRGQRANERGV